MGARGPKPSEHSVTRHPPKQQPKTMTAEPVDPPELDRGAYSARTLAWWDAWLESPQTVFFAATDWQTLLRLAPLVEAFFADPKAQLAAEIRQTEAKLGATAADRDRLGWKITPPPAPVGPGDEVAGSRDRPDPRVS